MVTTTPTRRGTDAARRVTVTYTDGGRRIVYAEYGRPDGTPVVFLHGTPGSHRLGELLDAAARARSVRVLAPSRPGYSRSSPWPRRSVCDAADSVRPVLDDADVPAAGLVGFSGGGLRALAMAAEFPHRITRVDLVSTATPPEISAETPLPQRLFAELATRAPAVLRGLLRGGRWIAPRLGPSFVVGQYTTDGSTVSDDTAEVVGADFREAFAHHRSGAVAEFRNTAAEWGIDYGAVTPEIRIWHGREDTNVPVGDARRLERELSGAERRVLEDTDHLRTLLRSAPDVLDAHR